MNTSSKKVYIPALMITVAFLLLCTSAYAYAILFEYDAHLGHFESSIFSSVFLPLLYVLAAVVFLVYGIVFRGALSGREYRVALPSIFASGFAALSTAVWLVTLIPYGLPKGEGAAVLPLMQMLFWALLLIAALILIAHLVLSAMPTPPRTPAVLAATFAMLFPVAYAFFAYFDTAFALNSPVKLLDQVAMLSILLFLLTEGRMRFGAVSEAVFLPVTMLSTVLSGTTSIGAFIYMVVKGTPLFASVMHDFLFFGFFLLTLTRLISFLLPTFNLKAEESVTPASRTFETEGAGAAPVSPDTFAQEAFDFDAEVPEDAPATGTEATQPEEATEATLDVENTEEQ